jgi:NAD(P)-dependent dehydrogenase (short-subunit alcohol dehydrogenase family)
VARELRGAVVVLTGASSGIGRATALMLAGIVHLIGMHLTLRSARCLAHENGTYELLAAEHHKLDLGIELNRTSIAADTGDARTIPIEGRDRYT